MRYFLVDPYDITGARAVLRGDDARHIRTVLRLKPGNIVYITDGNGTVHESRIVRFAEKNVELGIVSQRRDVRNTGIHITVAQPFLKNVKMDRLIRPLSELGVSTWIVFLSDHAVSRPTPNRICEREGRWRKIARESLKQCGRTIPMEIVTVSSFPEMLATSRSHDCRIVFWEKASKVLDYSRMSGEKPMRHVFTLFGPEGGFSDNEYKMALEHQFLASSLGPRILRAETAPLAACAVLQYVFGDMGPKKQF